MYTEYLLKVCQVYGINYILLDAMIPTAKQVEMIMEKLTKDKISF